MTAIRITDDFNAETTTQCCKLPVESDMGKKRVKLDDTTLRDGEQTAGVVFTNEEKFNIAMMLDEIGIDQIEAGIPVMGGDEAETIARIADAGLNASVLGWNRAAIGDIKASIACGVDAVAISLATSDLHIETKLFKDRAWVLDSIRKSVAYAKEHDVYVSVNAEDASRTGMDFLVEFAKAAASEGADRLRFCDTIGLMEPFRMYSAIKTLIEETGLEIEMHTHNDFGLATANALAGIHAGATWCNVTVGGLGERAGNSSLEQVAMALKYIEGQEINIDSTKLYDITDYVLRAAGRELVCSSPVVGWSMFAHESGIHADGIIKNPATYEVFPPEEVGQERNIILGKHSGTATVKLKLAAHGIEDVTRQDLDAILAVVRAKAVALKRTVNDRELLSIYHDYKNKKESA
jgi:homocitrate synthase NifV